MKATVRMFGFMVKEILQEMMLILLIVAPILAGCFFRFGIPFLEKSVLSRYGFDTILVPYYELFGWLFAMLTGMLFAFVGGLVVLSEIDDHVTRYIMVTPAGIWGYLGSRIMIPALLSGVMALVCVPLFSLCELSALRVIVMVFSTVLSGIVTALLVVAISSNKVEGMAVGKLSGLFGMTFFIPLFVRGTVRYVFGIFPMFWIGRWYQSPHVLYLIVAAAEFLIWIICLWRRFLHKIQ